MKTIQSKKIRASANGQECNFNIVGVCNYDPSTTVLCHLPDESSGMGKKSHDICAAYGCSGCHDAIDGRLHSLELEDHKEWYMRRAMVRTIVQLVDQGLVVIK